MKRIHVLLFIFSLCTFMCFGQTPAVHTYREQLRTATHDTVRAELYYQIGETYTSTNFDTALTYAEKGIELALRSKHKKLLGSGLKMKGVIYYYMGRMEESKAFADSALQTFESISYQDGMNSMLEFLSAIAFREGDIETVRTNMNRYVDILKEAENYNLLCFALLNWGTMELETGGYEKALLLLMEGLETAEKREQRDALGNIYNAVGEVHRRQGNIKEAMQYYELSLPIQIEMNNRIGVALIHMNFGNIYSDSLDFDASNSEFRKALHIFRDELGEPVKSAGLMSNIGVNYMNMNQLDSASHYLYTAIEAMEHIGMQYQVGETHNNIAALETKRKNYKLAEEHAFKGLEVANNTGDIPLMRLVHSQLSEIYELQGEFEKALEHYKEYKNCSDTIFSLEKAEQLNDMESTYQLAKREEEIVLLEAENNISELTIQRQYIILAAVLLVLILVSALAIFVYRNKRKLEKAHLQIKEQNDIIRLNNKNLKELSNFKNTMVSMIVHDLKNPLGGIIGLSQMMQEKEEGRFIRHAAKNMLNMVMNILDINKFEESAIHIERKSLPAKTVLNESQDQVELLASERNISIEMQVEDGLELHADNDMMVRVFVNLLTNAIKYSDRDSSIQVRAQRKDEQLLVEVEDHGCGIAKDLHEKIFEKYHQINARRSGKTSSSGLGLSFCKMAVEAHGGRIFVNSEPEKGSTFSIQI